MSEAWAERQRGTNRLVRTIAAYVFRQEPVTSDQLYGLCKLTWITSSFDHNDAAYIESTKLPALGDIFGLSITPTGLDAAAAHIASLLPSVNAESLILEHSGFTHFYKAYRNSVRQWIADHFETLLPMFKRAYALETDAQGLDLVRRISQLDKIPTPGGEHSMRPEFLLTPIFFALDPRLRFPIINGNEKVTSLLAALKVKDATLETQYDQFVSLIGKGGIKDAADLDQLGDSPGDLADVASEKPTKKLLSIKPVEGNELPLKDENDIESIRTMGAVSQRRIHNQLTNMVRRALSNYILWEGVDEKAKYDVLVHSFDGEGHDLLIEVKSSNEIAQIRMAIGQAFDYWFRIKGGTPPLVAILLSEAPMLETILMLEWLKVGCLWFEGDSLQTCSDWLRTFVDSANRSVKG